MRGSWFKWAHKVKKEGRWRGVGIRGEGENCLSILKITCWKNLDQVDDSTKGLISFNGSE